MRRLSDIALPLTAILGAALFTWWLLDGVRPAAWSEVEVDAFRGLWIGNLQPLPPDPSNVVAEDRRAAKFGQRLFFDTRLSGNGEVSCATCHQPDLFFADALPRGQAIGSTKRNTPSIVGVAHSPWMFWDGRRDSLWSQAISPLEDANEHGGSRLQYVHLVATDPGYRKYYAALFGPLPDISDRSRFPEKATPLIEGQWKDAWLQMTEEDRHTVNKIYANVGKSMAAYERLLMPGRSRFDAYVEAVIAGDETSQHQLYNDDEIKGLRLFVGKAKCTRCHNGPLLTNHEFHNTGVVSSPGEVPDKGRVEGVRTVKSDPFNCLGREGDPDLDGCAELFFVREGEELIGAMKTPSLRNLEGTSPYMHKGQMQTIADVLNHYNLAPLAMIGHNETEPLNLSPWELSQLESFLATLAAPIAASAEWLESPMVK